MHIVFLPGAGGAAEFWHPLGTLLPATWKKTYLSWPGLGNQPHDSAVNGFEDLVRIAEQKIHEPTVIIAQSMGGIVGVRLALKHPEKVTHLILTVTSGGIDVSSLGAEDWRNSYFTHFPNSQRWISTEKPDHSADIPNITCPTLLIWGDCDPICPPSVGECLSSLIKNSTLRIIEGGTHDLGKERAGEIAPMIISHINKAS